MEKSKTGILAWVGKDGFPETRWMSPGINNDAVVAITMEDFPKVIDLEKNNAVQWMFQNPELTEIVNVYGKVQIIEDAGYKSEILEKLSKNLVAIWKLKEDGDFVVLETIIEKAVYYDTMNGIKTLVKFEEE